jgi:hypothetical protein
MVDDGELRQQRIAVVAARIDRVAAVGELGPDAVGQEFVVGRFGPVGDAAGVARVRAQHFLQEDEIGADRAHGFAQLRQDETPVERGKALVRVHRHHLERTRRCGIRSGQGIGGRAGLHSDLCSAGAGLAL